MKNQIKFSDFIEFHEETKKYFEDITSVKVLNVDFAEGTCKVKCEDNITNGIRISDLVEEVYLDGMGILENPEILDGWNGFLPES